MKSLIIAIAMYSKLPVPRVDWEKRALSWALCWFPVVGIAVGALLWLWMRLSAWLSFGPALFAAVAVLLPIAVTGGIHMDGFCDTADALSSHQTRERKLEILKDSHTGAFAIICCCIYFLLFFAAWNETDPSGGSLWVLALVPVLSRSLSGLFCVTQPNARGSGLLCTFTEPMDGAKARVILLLWVLAAIAAMLALDLWSGLWAMGGAALVCVYFFVMSRRQFGGITGDLAGFFLQLCELAAVLLLAVGQKVGALL